MSNLQIAQAGTLESNDIQITLSPAPAGSGIEIELTSSVLVQYGEQIRATIHQTILQHKVTDIVVKAHDRGALDCTVRARTLAALGRAGVCLQEAGI
ncbi:citrate lyase subunit gamma (acyl carrier protein) [Sporomusaceae bacterium BoRhaA]|jgi:citrate lyase subunit gamma (acyl carrier protein)|uniref:citrate lyase acyl carrier protein n=1 Tax=Pelorhabdus rhamnosifermentans TaxID=2772457 RepID=UPI001C063310|nr:citrate lyase acyl carrier protein [Pelorhabdus rhamnosifermentans]MBU2699586.1 citrate lyase subunit gamma (acyl carrier protein) [Pelorhabdus rhamnosifermentans]